MLFRSGKNHLFEIKKYCVKETVATKRRGKILEGDLSSFE